MCGIVGLHLRDETLYPRLGELLTGMLCEMEDRGQDSAGVAVYGDPVWSPEGHSCVSLLSEDESGLAEAVTARLGSVVPLVSVERLGDTTLLTAPVASEELLAAVRAVRPDALVAGFGSDLTVLKGVGHPRALAATWQLEKAQLAGRGHTRMATESAVTPSGAHPYAVGPEQCLVHNGSFSNHATIRRELRAAGVRFDSENDTEVGARFVAHQLEQGRDVQSALKELCATFDGFYTLLVSNSDSFAVVRDAIACKPAVIAETEAWVAMASEYRACRVCRGSPTPGSGSRAEVVYAWTR